MSRTEISRRVHRRWRLISGMGSLATALLLGVVIMLRGNTALGIDAEWMEEIVEHRHPAWEVPSRLMDFLGGTTSSIIISLGLVALLIIRGRRFTALYFGIAALCSTLLVQVLKALFGRARPEEMLLSLDSGSFPSGHTANAATLAVAVAIITWRLWAVLAGAAYVVLMALSRTYLGAHWLSDTVGGFLIGAAVAIIVWAPLAERVLSERTARQ